MSQSQAEEAIRTAISTVLGNIPKEADNCPVSVGANWTKWAQIEFLGSASVPSTIGTNGLDRVDGVVQITMHYPLRSGTSVAAADFDSFRTAFPAGKVLTYSGQAATVRSCSKARGRKTADDYQMPISLVWFAFLTR